MAVLLLFLLPAAVATFASAAVVVSSSFLLLLLFSFVAVAVFEVDFDFTMLGASFVSGCQSVSPYYF